MAQNEQAPAHQLEDNQNDWDIPDENLNGLQRFLQGVARKTKGIVTIGNTITLMGGIIVTDGLIKILNGDKTAGAIEIASGRSCDLADGAAAKATKTRGRLGRDFDPTVDTLELLAAAPILTYAGVLPLGPAIVVGGAKVADTVSSIAARKKGRELNPSQEGKYRAMGIWTGASAFLLKAALDHRVPGYVDAVLDGVGYVGTVGATALTLDASVEYARVGFGPEPAVPLATVAEEFPEA